MRCQARRMEAANNYCAAHDLHDSRDPHDPLALQPRQERVLWLSERHGGQLQDKGSAPGVMPIVLFRRHATFL